MDYTKLGLAAAAGGLLAYAGTGGRGPALGRGARYHFYVVDKKKGVVLQGAPDGVGEEDLWLWIDEVSGESRKNLSVWTAKQVRDKFGEIKWASKRRQHGVLSELYEDRARVRAARGSSARGRGARNYFSAGDRVRSVEGPHKGREGAITTSTWENACYVLWDGDKEDSIVFYGTLEKVRGGRRAIEYEELTIAQETALIDAEIAKFPSTFWLPRESGRFRFEKWPGSFVTSKNEVSLNLQEWNQSQERWEGMGRYTPAEIRRMGPKDSHPAWGLGQGSPKGSSARGRRAKTKKPKSIFVQGRRWRDSYGNTYHTADIIVDEELVYTTPITYGYGEHYVDTTATKWLIEQGYLKGGKRSRPAWTLAREQGIDFDYAAQNVRRKKDL